MAEYNRDHKRMRTFAFGYGAPNNPHSKIVKVVARSSLEAGREIEKMNLVANGQQAHFLVDSADTAVYKKTVAAGSGRPQPH